MKCALLSKPGVLTVTEVEKPAIDATEVLIQIEMAAICGSDAALYHGKCDVPLPRIPGHEAVGRIAALGKNVTHLKLGQRVVLQPNYGCEICHVCQSGMSNICPRKVRIGLDVNGVFGQYTAVPGHTVCPVPNSLTNEIAVFTEPTAVALHGLNKAKPRKGQRVLVLGAGVIGLLMIQLVVNEGGQAFAMDLVKQRVSLANRLGAAGVFTEPDILKDQKPFDIIYETSGAPAALSQAIDVAAPGASIVILGLAGTMHPVMSSAVVRKELKIFGSMIYTDEFPAVLELLANGDIRTQPLVSGMYSLETIPEALETFSQPDRVKTLIRIKE